MKKKYYLLSITGILIAAISFSIGYLYSYAHSLEKEIDMYVSIHSNILLTNSVELTQKLKSPSIEELIEATEENGDSLARAIINYKPFIENPESNRLVEIALTKWEKTKESLQELRTLKSKNNNSP